MTFFCRETLTFSGAREKTIHEKTRIQKISWHCPFKPRRKSACLLFKVLKVWSGPHGILRGLVEIENWKLKKTWIRKSRGTVPLTSYSRDRTWTGGGLNPWTPFRTASSPAARTSISETSNVGHSSELFIIHTQCVYNIPIFERQLVHLNKFI